ncbi:MAG: Type I phosphodiesterase / nucleotide pyrophosphatase [Microgenomates group bacterium ADurb.Bin219]|nr:MAG: Type I phosphodiesterase / nucleotide pyrophosphatase [Microgenomates group bacterium ADurb.Bin219]
MKKRSITMPLYKGGSICNILPTIAEYNSIKTSDRVERYTLEKETRVKFIEKLREAKRIVILEVDALAYDLFARIKKGYGFLEDSIKISSVFPTYTHTAFASFITGASPSKHGVVAGTFMKDGVVDWMGNLSKSEKFSRNLITCESLLQNFNKQGKKVVSILYDVNDDNFSRYLYPNPIFVSSKSSAQILIEQAYDVEKRVFKKILEFAPRDFYILSAYFWFLDGVSGEYGKFNKETFNYLKFFFRRVEHLMKKFPRKTLFVIMGDHGHTSLRKTIVIDQKSVEKINQISKSQFALDGRVMMFYSQNPNLTRRLFNEEAGSFVEEMSKNNYVRLIGGRCEVEDRIGNLIFLAKPHYTVRLKPKKKKATHGGLSKEEMQTVFGFFMN